jgi:acetolactate synthase-1/2/3 large subunit
MRAAEIDPVGVDLLTPDLPRLAEALGGSGRRADDPRTLESELRAALDRPGPTLVEVPA